MPDRDWRFGLDTATATTSSLGVVVVVVVVVKGVLVVVVKVVSSLVECLAFPRVVAVRLVAPAPLVVDDDNVMSKDASDAVRLTEQRRDRPRRLDEDELVKGKEVEAAVAGSVSAAASSFGSSVSSRTVVVEEDPDDAIAFGNGALSSSSGSLDSVLFLRFVIGRSTSSKLLVGEDFVRRVVRLRRVLDFFSSSLSSAAS